MIVKHIASVSHWVDGIAVKHVELEEAGKMG